MKSYDILIVGCGPVGACLALQMRDYGYTIGIFDRETDVYHHPRAMLLDDEGARTYQNMGIWGDMQYCVTTFRSGQTIAPNGKVIGGIIFPVEKPYGHSYHYIFYQPELEKVMRANFSKKEGIDLYIGHEVTEVKADVEQPSIVVKNLADGSTQEYGGKYVIGCDGARSLVKKSINPGRIDQEYSQDWYVIDAFIKDVKDVPLLPTEFQAFTGDQPVTYVPGVGLHRRLDFRIKPADMKLSNEELRAKLPDYLSYYIKDIDKLEIIRADRYTYRASTADTWRKERIILAGDSAHLMPPFAGQGMQSGIRDTHNLAFKLDLVLKGKAGDQLLNTYDQERIPHVVATTKGSIFSGRMNEAQDIVSTVMRRVLFTLVNYSDFVKRKMLENMEPKIPFTKGFLGSNHKAAGTMFIQPKVKNLAGKEMLMDDLFGNQLTILTNFAFPQSTIATFHKKTLGKTFTLKYEFIDHTHDLRVWMKKNKVDFVILRPDHYVFDAGRKGQEDKVLNQLYSFFN